MAELARTPLYDLHIELGARMVPFAGWEMPVQYPMGVLGEHLHTRKAAGLFDVSHMGQVILRGEGAAFAEWFAQLLQVRLLFPRTQQGALAAEARPTGRHVQWVETPLLVRAVAALAIARMQRSQRSRASKSIG